MAVLASIATGNFTAAGTWGLVDSTSYLNSETGSEVLTTAYSGTRSSGFNPGAITIDGIAVKLSVRTGTTGTISVTLELAGLVVSGTEVTINCADLPASATADLNGGWVFFKFASPVTLSSNTYTVAAKTSSSSQVSLFRDGTTDNIARYLRTTTTQAPAAGDDLIVTGEYTGAGTSNSFTVTMNNTASTDFGAASTSLVLPSLAICSKGTLQYGTTAATNYVLRQSGNVIVYSGGTLNIGTTGTPIPSDSTAVLEFDCGANVDFGLIIRNLGTCNLQGLSKTHALFLAADAAASATSGTLSGTPTNWKNTDVLVFASTTRTVGESEENALSADVSTTSFSFAALTNAHAGGGATNGSDVKAEVCNVTRNVKIRSVSSTNLAYVVVLGSSVTLDWDHAEFRYMGSATASKRGVEIQATGGSVNINGCVAKDSSGQTSAYGFYFNTTSGLSYSITNCVSWNTGTSGLLVVGTSATPVIDNFIAIKTASGIAITIRDGSGTVTNLTGVSAATHGVQIGEVNYVVTGYVVGDVDNLLGHSNGSNGVDVAESSVMFGKFGALTGWRNSNIGVGWDSPFRVARAESVRAFGNTTAGTGASNQGFVFVEIDTVSLDAGLVLTQPNGIYGISGNSNSVNLSVLAGGNIGQNQAHATADVNLYRGNYNWLLTNVTMHSTNKVINQSELGLVGSLRVQNTGAAPVHRTYKRQGTIAIETSTVHTGSQAMSMTPINASEKLESGPFFVAVANGATVTPSVYIYKHASYNGNQPRLILKRNAAIGISADTVIATYSASTGSWNAISGTTAAATDDGVMEFVIDCDGTAGAIYVDTFTGGANQTPGEMQFWKDGLPVPGAQNPQSSGGIGWGAGW